MPAENATQEVNSIKNLHVHSLYINQNIQTDMIHQKLQEFHLSFVYSVKQLDTCLTQTQFRCWSCYQVGLLSYPGNFYEPVSINSSNNVTYVSLVLQIQI